MRIVINNEVILTGIGEYELAVLKEGSIHYRAVDDTTVVVLAQKVDLLEADMNDTLLYLLHWHTNCSVNLKMYDYGRYTLDLQEVTRDDSIQNSGTR
jgi:hypothetical protein